MSVKIKHKRGATFDYQVLISGDPPVDFNQWVATCELRRPNSGQHLVGSFQMTKLANGWRLFSSSGETENWPVGATLEADLRIQSPGQVVQYSDLIEIEVDRSVTRA